MTSEDETVRIKYLATADFRQVVQQALAAKAAIDAMDASQQRANRNGAAGAAAEAAARRKASAANEEGIRLSKSAATGVEKESRLRRALNSVLGSQASAQRRSAASAKDLSAETKNVAAETDRAENSTRRATRSLGSLVGELLRSRKAAGDAGRGLDDLDDGMKKISAFSGFGVLVGGIVLLIAKFGGLLSLIEPGIALLGALSAAAAGAASSLASLAGAAVGLVPALSAALGVAVALKTALGGVGGAITAGISAATSTGGGGGGGGGGGAAVQDPFHPSAQEKITRAQRAYVEAIQDVHFAEQSLFDARRAYTRQVQDLTDAVDDYTNATKAADAASVESAQQNYDNVLASSSSTKPDKDAALAAIAQAKDQQQKDAEDFQRNQQDLAELKRGGSSNNQSVVDARRGVQDAKDARRDAQLALENAKYDAAHPASTGGGGGGGGGGTDPYAAALAKLSPAAQQFVRWVVGMRAAWESLQKTVQQAFFSKFVGDLDRLRGLLPPVQSMLVAIAGALGKVADSVLRQVTGADWRRDLVTFGKELAPVIATAGKGLQALLGAFKDLTLAAMMPFLGTMVKWLSKAAEKFGDFISSGRRTGSIQRYLDGIASTLHQWLTIIGHLVGGIVDLARAAKPFNDWITGGLVKGSADFLKMAEGAEKKGSPFKKWLDDIKPILGQVGTIVGGVFGFIAKTASDPKVLSALSTILKIATTKIGPGIATILDSLTKAKVPQAFVGLIGDIITLVATLVKNGGGAGIRNFFNTLDGLVKVLIGAAQSPIGKWVTNTFLPLIGAVAGFIVPLGPMNLFIQLIGRLAGFKPGAALGKLGGWLGDIVGALGRIVGPAFSGAASVIGDILGVLSAPIVIPKNLLPQDPNQKSKQDTAMIPTLKMPNLKLPNINVKDALKIASAALTTWAGGLAGLLGKGAGDAFSDVQGPSHWLGVQWKRISGWAGGLVRRVAGAAGDVFAGIKTAASWLSARWGEFSKWAGSLPGKVASAAGSIWAKLTGPGTWLGTQLGKITTWAGTLASKIGSAAAGLWNSMPSLGAWVRTQVTNIGGPIGKAVAKFFHFSKGGLVPGSGSGDTVSALLEPGEFVIPKALVKKIGLENLEGLRLGAKSYAQVIGGIAMQQSHRPTSHEKAAITPRVAKAPVAVAGSTTTNISVQQFYPAPQKAESIVRVLRNTSYLHAGAR